jgi:hypothetical protein
MQQPQQEMHQRAQNKRAVVLAQALPIAIANLNSKSRAECVSE